MDLVDAVADALAKADWTLEIMTREEARRVASAAIDAMRRWEIAQLEAGRDKFRETYAASLPATSR